MSSPHDDVLLHIAAPQAAPGSVRVLGAGLAAALENLAAFPATTTQAAAACRFVWLYADEHRLVGLATDLAATGQVEVPVVVGGGLPHFGLTPADAKKLAKTAKKAASLVTLGTAGAELVLTIGVDEAARVPLRLPTTVDTGVLQAIGNQLLTAANTVAAGNLLPGGCADVNTDLLGRFGTGQTSTARCWHLAGGRIYVEPTAHFRGYIKAARPTPSGARRPLPAGQVLPAIPTQRTAA